MLDAIWTKNLVNRWIGDWNRQDLDLIIPYYSANVMLVSPLAAELLKNPVGLVSGQRSLRQYFGKAIERFGSVSRELLDIYIGVSNVVVIFKNHKGTRTAEFMEIDADGKFSRVVASYSG